MPKYTEQTVGEVDIAQRHFLAGGGEKKVYAKGGKAYAIYDDPSRMIPPAKVQELAVLDRPNIIRPMNLLLDKKNQPVGFTMRLIKDTVPLLKLFTKTYRQNANVTPEMIVALIQTLQEYVAFVHSKKCLIVDLNELNFLTDEATHAEIYGIDVNSYMTPNFPATALMDSIRDRHAPKNQFTTETDWFAFGIIAFQLFIGIHPYRGKYAQFKSMSLEEQLEARMQKNICAGFDPDVKIPRFCQPFDVIPDAMKQWFHAMFVQGKRIPPPGDYEAIAAVITAVKEIVGSDLFEIAEVASFDGDVLDSFSAFGARLVRTTEAIYVNRQRYTLPNPDCKLGLTPKMNKPVAVWLDGDKVKVLDVVGSKEHVLPTRGDDIMTTNGRVYVRNNQQVVELVFGETSKSIMPTFKSVGRVLDLPDATRVFPGTIAQNLLGRWVFSIFPVTGRCYQLNLSELDEYRVIDAKYDNGVLMIVGEKGGQYDRFVLRLDDTYTKYDVRKVENVTYTGLNFTVAEHGVCICIDEQERVEAFHSKKDSATVKLLDDPAIDSDMRLSHDGAKVLFAKGDTLYSITMKKTQ